MEALTPCTGCARHIRSSESECPFCATPLAAQAAAAPRAPRIGRLTRAAVFAGAALIAPACGGTTATETQDTVSPPPDDTAEQQAREQAERDAEQRRLQEQVNTDQDENIQARPYGAPPRRDDLV